MINGYCEFYKSSDNYFQTKVQRSVSNVLTNVLSYALRFDSPSEGILADDEILFDQQYHSPTNVVRRLKMFTKRVELVECLQTGAQPCTRVFDQINMTIVFVR